MYFLICFCKISSSKNQENKIDGFLKTWSLLSNLILTAKKLHYGHYKIVNEKKDAE